MSAPSISRQPEGTPAGGQFTASSHPEAEGVALPAAAAECNDCGSDLEDGVCPGCTCSCGASLNDGEGYDGLCGNCADAEDDEESEQIFDMELTDAMGNVLDYSVNRIDDGHYEVRDDGGDSIAEFHHNGDDEDHSEIQDSAVAAMKAAGHNVSAD